MATPDDQRREHCEYQRRYFDKNCDFFRQSIPEEIEERTRETVRQAHLNSGSRVLDVGTGMGVLIKHFVEFGVLPENVVGCDLSSSMLEEAKKRFPQTTFWQGDIADFPVDEYSHYFDAVFFNACFGNIFDQPRAIAVASRVVHGGGAIIISHPLGNRFVDQLRSQDQNLVLTLMPDRAQLETFCRDNNLTLAEFRDETDFYLAKLVSAG